MFYGGVNIQTTRSMMHPPPFGEGTTKVVNAHNCFICVNFN